MKTTRANKVRIELSRKYGNKCFYCGFGKFEVIEHVIPRSRGGQDYIENLRPACNKCNNRKGTRTVLEWANIEIDKYRDLMLEVKQSKKFLKSFIFKAIDDIYPEFKKENANEN